MKEMRYTLRSLALLAGYPTGGLREILPELIKAIDGEAVLGAKRRTELRALCNELAQRDPFDIEARYVETFDRGRSTSLHLFEHVHGDSRDRGPAMIDLAQTYEKAGLLPSGNELPDHLTVVLEFASTQPPEVAREFLGEIAHILTNVFSALLKQQSPYASVIAAVLEMAGHKVQAVEVAPEPDLDEAWAEPEAFDGCSTRGQARPGDVQPMHFVRSVARQGVSQ